MNLLKTNDTPDVLKLDAKCMISSDKRHMSILGDGNEAMAAYLTNESGAEWPLIVRFDIAISVLTWAASNASWSWLLTIKIGSADSMITSSWAPGWSAVTPAASWAALSADAIAMIAAAIDFNEASDASEADCSDSDVESEMASVTKGWAHEFSTDDWSDGCRELNKNMSKPEEWIDSIEQDIWHDAR